MRVHVAGHRLGFLGASFVCVFSLVVIAGLQTAHATGLAEPDATALLNIKVSVEGSVDAPQGRKNEVVRWSTRGQFEATVQMVAQKPEQVSLGAMASNDPNAMPEAYTDLARQAEACGEDQACLMRMAMSLVNSPELEKAKNVPKRYQVWRAARDNAVVEVKGSQVDKLYSLFYVSGPEITDCLMTAPMVSPELTRVDPNAKATWEKINQDTRENSAKSFVVEVDGETGSSTLQMGAVSVGSGNDKCTLTVGGNAETQNRSASTAMLPIGELKPGLLLEGSAPGNGVIARGSQVINTTKALTQVVGFAVNVPIPITITVDWELRVQ